MVKKRAWQAQKIIFFKKWKNHQELATWQSKKKQKSQKIFWTYGPMGTSTTIPHLEYTTWGKKERKRRYKILTPYPLNAKHGRLQWKYLHKSTLPDGTMNCGSLFPAKPILVYLKWIKYSNSDSQKIFGVILLTFIIWSKSIYILKLNSTKITLLCIKLRVKWINRSLALKMASKWLN